MGFRTVMITLQKRTKIETLPIERNSMGQVIRTEKREYVKSASHIDFHSPLVIFLAGNLDKDFNPHDCPHALYDEYAKFIYSWGDSKKFKSEYFDEKEFTIHISRWDAFIRPIVAELP